MNRKRTIRRVMTILLGVAVGLGLAEMSLRLIWTPPKLRSIITIGAHWAYSWAPLPGLGGTRATSEYEHTVHHTEQRLRGNHEFDRDRPAGIEKRLLLLGDSYTYGQGVADNESFAAILDAAWPNVEVANAGCPGYGTSNSLAVLHHLGNALQPDVTVLVFFWNDLEDDISGEGPDFELDAAGRVQQTKPKITEERDPLARSSAADRTYASRWSRSYVAELFRIAITGFRLRVWGLKARTITTEERLAEAWSRTDRFLMLMAARAKEIGTELVVVSVPDHSQVNPEARIKSIDPINFEIQERLAVACEAAGIRCLDFRDAMHASWKATGEDYYYRADRHLTPAGHRVFAELLRAQLEPLLLEAKR